MCIILFSLFCTHLYAWLVSLYIIIIFLALCGGQGALISHILILNSNEKTSRVFFFFFFFFNKIENPHVLKLLYVNLLLAQGHVTSHFCFLCLIFPLLAYCCQINSVSFSGGQRQSLLSAHI